MSHGFYDYKNNVFSTIKNKYNLGTDEMAQ